MEGLLSPWHLLIVLVVAVLVFGPNKLPEIARQLGRGLQELRKFRSSLDDDVRSFFGDDDTNAAPEQGKLPPSDGGDRRHALPETSD